MTEHRQATAPFWLDMHKPDLFPDVSLSLKEPDGLLAIGGDLSVQRLLAAYQRGIFPWYSHDQPILWWSPDPRMVLFPDELHVSRSLRKKIRRSNYRVCFDTAFAEVMDNCAAPRDYTSDTWITDEMKQAYHRLHQAGYAHSTECWQDDMLIGGLYGIAIGKVFFGESMFAKQSDASKVAFIYLVRQLQDWGYQLIDCQVYSSHLASLGARPIAREDFIAQLSRLCRQPSGHEWQPQLKLKDIISTE